MPGNETLLKRVKDESDMTRSRLRIQFSQRLGVYTLFFL